MPKSILTVVVKQNIFVGQIFVLDLGQELITNEIINFFDFLGLPLLFFRVVDLVSDFYVWIEPLTLSCSQ